MRLAFVLVVIAATFLVVSEASTTTESNRISKVASPTGQNQRLRRAHNTIIKDYPEYEERALPQDKMKKMMKGLTTKEDLANTLGISQKIDDIMNGEPGMIAFMRTLEYQQYVGYVNFLNDMAKIKKYNTRCVQKIKEKSRNA